jgi:putative transposase
VTTAVGVDLGLTDFATLSNGVAIPNPKFLRQAEAMIARRHQAMSRKVRGSRNRQRAKGLVARAYERVRHQTKNFSWHLAHRLLGQFDLISHEDLHIQDLRESAYPSIRRSFQATAWRVFLGCLTSKAEEAGCRVVRVNARGTSQRCSNCGADSRTPFV